MSLLALRDVCKSYDQGRIRSLDGVSLAIEPGERVAVVGKSGSGKSTLVHISCGLSIPDSGSVAFRGAVVGTQAAWRRIRASAIGLVFQQFHLIPTLTAAENVEAPLIGSGLPGRERKRRVLALLSEVGLAGRQQEFPQNLSGGERQRIAICRALVHEPMLVLADEPTGNLDEETSAEIVDILLRVSNQRGAALLLVTHDPDIAARLGRIVRMRDGQILSDRQSEAAQ